MAYFENGKNNTLISGTSSNDSIFNYGDKVTINGGKGNDSIRNGGDKVTINGGKGNDSIQSNGDNVSINSGKGNDSLNSYGTGTVYIYNSGDGNDTIDNFNMLDTLVITGAKYTTSQKDGYALVTVGKNNITLGGVTDISTVNITSSTKNISPVNIIDNHAGNTTVKGKSSSNVIKSYGANVSINAGAGDDSIRTHVDNVSINAGKGNDTIDTISDNVKLFYASGDGKDIILGNKEIMSGSNVTVNLTSGTLGSISKSGNGDIVVKVGKGSLTFKDYLANKITVKDSKGKSTVINAGRKEFTNTKDSATVKKTSGSWYISNSGSKAKITTGSGSDGIENLGDKATINSGAGNDYVKNNGDNVSINSGKGNDYIRSYGAKTTIRGGSGNDYIYNDCSDKVTMSGGAGNDSIRNYGENVSINGGKGNDSLWGSSYEDTFIYAKGDGKDVIYGFDDDDLLKITGTFSASYSKSKAEVYFKVSNTSKAITLKNFTASSFNVNGDTYKISGSKLVKQ